MTKKYTVEIPHSALQALADIGIEADHDSNGPGQIICRACDAHLDMAWAGRRHVERLSDIKHRPACPAEWARRILESRQDPVAPESDLGIQQALALLERSRQECQDLRRHLLTICRRYEHDGIPGDSLPIVTAALDAILRLKGGKASGSEISE